QTFFRGDFASKNLFHHTVFDVTNLRQGTQANTTRVLGGAGVQLFNGNVCAHVLGVEIGVLGLFKACFSHRHIAGVLVPGRRLLRAGDKVEEFGHALVDIIRFLGKDPQGSTTNDGVLRRALYIAVVGQAAGAKFKFAGFDDVGTVTA